MIRFRKSSLSSRLDKLTNAEPQLVALNGKDAHQKPEIVRQFGNGYQRLRREEPVRTWSAADDFSRKCLLVIIFSIVCVVITFIFYAIYLSYSTFKECERSHNVNRYLYKQAIMECFQSKMNERRINIGQSLEATFGR